MKRGLFWLSLSFGVLGAIALLTNPFEWNLHLGPGAPGVTASLQLQPSEARAQSAEQGLESLRSQSKAFVQIAKSVRPSVVSITSERNIKVTGFPGSGFPGGDELLGRFFHGPMQGTPEVIPQQGSGSGVVVSRDGYILTNNHVVAEADKIQVTMDDGRTFDGELVGRDPKSDVAVIRVKANDLTPIQIGDSDQLEVGEWVVAVGNPFQLSSTVTAGIVSAVGRSNIGLADYEDFIQTDAAINPGNSGGALVNLEGQFVGINTAIASRSGGYQGIGFAIPSNMAKKVMDSLISRGKVVRGWIGVSLQDLTEEMAESFGLDRPQGALVGQVMDDSPASRAGIKQGDLITEFEGREVKNVRDLRLWVTGETPGTTVDLKIMRNGRTTVIPIKLGELEAEKTGVDTAEGTTKEIEPDRTTDLGLTVTDLTLRTRNQLDLPSEVDGVLITDVDPLKPAGRAGLQQGDLVLKVGDTPVSSVRSLDRALREVPRGKPALLLIRRAEAEIFVGVRMPG
jgi:serine protease Do